MPQEGKSKFPDAVRDRLRYEHYSLRTEQSYVGWIKRFILFQYKRHPGEIGDEEATAFHETLAAHGGVASVTMIYTQVPNKGGRGVVSPPDR